MTRLMRRILMVAVLGSWPLVNPTPGHAATASHLTFDIRFDVRPTYVWVHTTVSVDDGELRMGVSLTGPDGVHSYDGEIWKPGPDSHVGGMAVKPGAVYRSTVCAEARGAWGEERRCEQRTRAFPEPVADFNGDGRTDFAVYRPEDKDWYVLGPSGDTVQFGGWIWRQQIGAIPVPGDYDNDNRADPAIRKRELSVWEFQLSTVKDIVASLGAEGDVTVPADYNGDGATDVATFQPATGTWSIIDLRLDQPAPRGPQEVRTAQWGGPGDRAAPADYTGDGIIDLAVYRPGTSTWHVRRSEDGASEAVRWGARGDVPVPGDYDGDRRADLAVFRPSTGDWLIRPSNGAPTYQVRVGGAGDRPAPGDYDGDGRVDPAAVRSGTPNRWFVRRADGTVGTVEVGLATDVPIPSLYLPR